MTSHENKELAFPEKKKKKTVEKKKNKKTKKQKKGIDFIEGQYG